MLDKFYIYNEASDRYYLLFIQNKSVSIVKKTRSFAG